MKERLKKTIEKLDDDLNGVCFNGGKKYVVSKTLPGEEVLCEVERTSGNAVVCNLKKVLTPSEKRVRPKCIYFGDCGGCQMLMTSYKEQLLIKSALVKRKFSGFDVETINECVGNVDKEPRNKVHICFEEDEKGFIRAGFFNDETHKVVDIENCIMNGEWYHDLVKILIAFIKGAKLSIYSPKTGNGILRFAVARRNERGIMLTLVVTRNEKCDYKPLYDRLKKRFNETSLYVNVNDRKTNEVLSEKFIHIMGGNVLSGEIAGVKYEISPNSFMQTNHKMAERIYLDLLKKIDGQNVVDLFSGIGITSILFAKSGKSVESVEIVESAVQNAKNIAKLNNVQNIRFYRGDCNDILPKLDIKNKTLFVDPPRAGLTEEIVNTILENEPKSIIYLSCSLKTLIEDIKSLSVKYRIKEITPYDMFMGTKHLETIIELCLKDEFKEK